VEELEHPAWCDPVHCTATVQKPRFRAGETGYHRSMSMTLEHMPNVGTLIFDPELNPVTAHLEQAAPPWDTGTFLSIGTLEEPGAVSLPLDQAQAVLRQLLALTTAGDGTVKRTV
jgi:hypothetical protein